MNAQEAARYVVDRSGPLHRVVRSDGVPLGFQLEVIERKARYRPAPPPHEPVRALPWPTERQRRLARTLAARQPVELQTAPDGAELRRRRDALGLSQRQLAEVAQYSRSALAAIELGLRPNARARLHISKTLERLERQA